MRQAAVEQGFFNKRNSQEAFERVILVLGRVKLKAEIAIYDHGSTMPGLQTYNFLQLYSEAFSSTLCLVHKIPLSR